MNYIFCPSYQPLFFALYLKDLRKEVTVITYNEGVRQFCTHTKIKHIHFELLRPGILDFFKVVILKKRLDHVIKKIDFSEEDNFYLLGREIAYEGFYLAKELSKRGTAYFRNASREYEIYGGKFSRVFLEMLAIKYLFKMFLGLDLIFYETYGNPRFGINDKFLEKNRVATIDKDRDFDELILDIARKSNIYQKKNDNLIASDGMLYEAEFNSLVSVYKYLSNLPLAFVIKKHPNQLKRESQIDEVFEEYYGNCEEIPGYIPIELVLNSIRKNVISVCSAALIVASQMEHLKAISLLELVEWHNQRYKNEVKNYLKESSNNRIIFVNDFEELRKLLLNKDNA